MQSTMQSTIESYLALISKRVEVAYITCNILSYMIIPQPILVSVLRTYDRINRDIAKIIRKSITGILCNESSRDRISRIPRSISSIRTVIGDSSNLRYIGTDSHISVTVGAPILDRYPNLNWIDHRYPIEIVVNESSIGRILSMKNVTIIILNCHGGSFRIADGKIYNLRIMVMEELFRHLSDKSFSLFAERVRGVSNIRVIDRMMSRIRSLEECSITGNIDIMQMLEIYPSLHTITNNVQYPERSIDSLTTIIRRMKTITIDYDNDDYDPDDSESQRLCARLVMKNGVIETLMVTHEICTRLKLEGITTRLINYPLKMREIRNFPRLDGCTILIESNRTEMINYSKFSSVDVAILPTFVPTVSDTYTSGGLEHRYYKGEWFYHSSARMDTLRLVEGTIHSEARRVLVDEMYSISHSRLSELYDALHDREPVDYVRSLFEPLEETILIFESPNYERQYNEYILTRDKPLPKSIPLPPMIRPTHRVPGVLPFSEPVVAYSHMPRFPPPMIRPTHDSLERPVVPSPMPRPMRVPLHRPTQ